MSDRDDDKVVDFPHTGGGNGRKQPSDTGGLGPLPCRWCGELTQRTTLAQYGARCFRCYEAYCRAPQPSLPFMADKRVDGPKAWAYSLKAREESGERLSQAQRDMWRAALRNPMGTTEEPA